MSGRKFINPYSFVPRISRPEYRADVGEANSSLLEGGETGPASQAMRHDCHGKGTFSGRILCELTTESPCVFGGIHEKPMGDDWFTVVENFRLQNEIAIPGSSLRGMISSIAEAASGSAMRVLTNRLLTMRSQMQQSRSAIGMVYEHEGRRSILPLTYPNIRHTPNPKGDQRKYQPLDGSTPAQWKKINDQMYNQEGDAQGMVGFPAYVDLNPKLDGKSLDSFCAGNNEVFAIREKDIDSEPPIWLEPSSIGFNTFNDAIYKEDKTGGTIRPAKFGGGLKIHCYDESTADKEPVMWPGILRVLPRNPLDTEGKKKFNLFIPVPPKWVTDGKFTPPPVALLEASVALQRFEATITTKTATIHNNESDGQFSPLQGQAQDAKRLAHGDLVHFDLEAANVEKNGLPVVKSVAISSIWREGPTYLWEDDLTGYGTSTTTDIIPLEDRPFSRTRKTLSIAERMFGWVTPDKRSKDPHLESRYLRAYRGRVIVSNARLGSNSANLQLQNEDNAWVEFCKANKVDAKYWPYFPLQILASPKPPCPEFYFQFDDSVENFRENFFDRDDLAIKGTKFYWNHERAIQNGNTWNWTTTNLQDNPRRKTKANLNQKALVQPVGRDAKFYFHIDFENLTEDELNLLCFAVTPNQDFHHKLGFAKPLGLGSVTINPVRIGYVDPVSKYRKEIDLLTSGGRFTAIVGDGDCPDTMPACYAELAHSTDDAQNHFAAVDVRARAWSDANRDVAEYFSHVGRPVDAKLGVCYPQAIDDFSEHEIFRWFVTNRDRKRRKEGEQKLPHIDGPLDMKTNL